MRGCARVRVRARARMCARVRGSVFFQLHCLHCYKTRRDIELNEVLRLTTPVYSNSNALKSIGYMYIYGFLKNAARKLNGVFSVIWHHQNRGIGRKARKIRRNFMVAGLKIVIFLTDIPKE